LSTTKVPTKSVTLFLLYAKLSYKNLTRIASHHREIVIISCEIIIIIVIFDSAFADLLLFNF